MEVPVRNTFEASSVGRIMGAEEQRRGNQLDSMPLNSMHFASMGL